MPRPALLVVLGFLVGVGFLVDFLGVGLCLIFLCLIEEVAGFFFGWIGRLMTRSWTETIGSSPVTTQEQARETSSTLRTLTPELERGRPAMKLLQNFWVSLCSYSMILSSSAYSSQAVLSAVPWAVMSATHQLVAGHQQAWPAHLGRPEPEGQLGY